MVSFGFRGRHGHRMRGKAVPEQAAGPDRSRIAAPRQCICPRCGMVTDKIPGQPCFVTACPRCQAMMAGRFPAEQQREQSHEE